MVKEITSSPVVWCLLDRRPGHRNQVLGLAEALRERLNAQIHHVEINGVFQGILQGMTPRFRLPTQQPSLLIGAGHSTHMPLLQLGLRTRAKTIVLMKPTFPFRLFDLCLLPSVYQLRRTPPNVVLTTGVLNRIRPSVNQDSGLGMFLIGGPCDHHQWSSEQVLQQVATIVRESPLVSWTVVTSRRTPDSFIELIRTQVRDAQVCTPDSVGADWLPQNMGRHGKIWVTADSVSMMYEAVTSGSATGMLELERIRSNRATKAIDLLLDTGLATAFEQWAVTRVLEPASRRISEAERCASEISQRFFVEGGAVTQQRQAA